MGTLAYGAPRGRVSTTGMSAPRWHRSAFSALSAFSVLSVLYRANVSGRSATTYAITAIAATQRASSPGSSLSSMSPSLW